MKLFNKKIFIFFAFALLFAVLFMIQKGSLNLGSSINNTINDIVASVLPGSSGGQNQDVPMADNGEPIQIAYTDDNGGENLIIATDKETYNGFSNSDVHISLKNIDAIDHNGQLLFYFPIKDDTKIKLPATVKKVQVYQSGSTSSPRAGKWQPVGISTAAIGANDPILKDALAKQKGIPKNMTFRGAVNFSAKSGETVYFKAEINYPPGGVGEFFIEGIADRGGYGLLDPYYSSAYSYRRPLIINHNKVSTVSGTTLSNFPVLVNVTNNDLKTTAFGGKAASGSGEFVFTSSDGITTLPYEIETYSSSSGQFIGWVKVASLSPSFDTTMYMYYGSPGPGAATNQNKTAVWDTNYRLVQHMKETLGTISDSTSYGNNGTNTGGAVSTTASKIGNGYTVVDGDDNRIQTPYNSSWNGAFNGYTAQAWIKVISSGNYRGFFAVGAWGGVLNYWIYPTGQLTGTFTTSVNGTFGWTAGPYFPVDSNYHHVAMTYDSGTGNVITYIDGVATHTVTGKSGTASLGTSNIAVGNFADSVLAFTGGMDEFRVSSVGRSADWIKTEYNNQGDPGTFIGMNAPQAPTRTAPSVNIKGGVKVRGGVQFR